MDSTKRQGCDVNTRLGLALHNDLLDLAESVTPMPATVTRLAAAVASEQCEIEDVTTILREDPMVVAALLRESNSAVSAPVTEIVTVEAAIVRLGMGRVLAVATDCGVTGQTRDELASYELSAGALWEHSVRASYVAETIYQASPSLTGPEVVSAALLHDIGQMLLDKVLDPAHFLEARKYHKKITHAERELADVDHAELGALLLELWEVPSSIVEAVRYHHQPDVPGTAMAHIVCMSNLLVHEIFCTPSSQPVPDAEQIVQCLAALELDRAEIVERSRTVLTNIGHAPPS